MPLRGNGSNHRNDSEKSENQFDSMRMKTREIREGHSDSNKNENEMDEIEKRSVSFSGSVKALE